MTDRFAKEPEKKTCSTKGCENTLKTDDRLLTKCQECRQKELKVEREAYEVIN